MFQSLAIPSHQSIAVNRRLPAPLSVARIPRRRLPAVRCRVAAVEDFAGCLVASRNPANSSLYEVLRVKQNASSVDIKKAYRRLAKQYHPDAAAAVADSSEDPVDGRDFIQIHSAYATLSNPKSRDAYDRSIGVAGRRMVARSAASTTSFGSYSSSPRSSPRSSVRRGHGFYPTRRWESDQCW